jgi:hypothetical protein
MENYSNTEIDEQHALTQLLVEAMRVIGELNGTTTTDQQTVANMTSLHHEALTQASCAELISQVPESLLSDLGPVLTSLLACPVGMTTVMIRNVPRKCTQRMLLGEVIAEGYGETIDFVYLPTDISTGKNLGYAFVNFVHPYHAESFRKSLHKKHLASMRGSRTGLSVSYAVIQGLEANITNVMKNASVHRIRNPEYLPLIRDVTRGGQLVPCVFKGTHNYHSPTISPAATERQMVSTALKTH